MIFLFHSLYFLAKYAIKIYKKHRALNEFHERNKTQLTELIEKIHNESDIEHVLCFDPPVFRQRYAAVQQVLLDDRWRKDIKKIVEFGCAELNFFQYLKHLYGITEILEVDFDESVLEENRNKCEPLTADFLKQRSEALVVKILCGNISDCDYRLMNCDAVIGIEIIEHLYPDTLDAIPFNIFGFIKPRIVIFTTPNADFNVLFPRFKGIRHADHKFEWTRQQFSDWANNISERYPQYSVLIEGIGNGPKGTEFLGDCSQMAIFIREYSTIYTEVPSANSIENIKHTNAYVKSHGVCTFYSYINQFQVYNDTKPIEMKCDKIKSDISRYYKNNFYKLIGTVNYPFISDTRTSEEKILHEAMYNIYRQATVNSRFFNEDENLLQIPLYDIICNTDGCFTTETEARKLLEEADFTIKECCLYGCDEPCLCVIYDINMDQHSSSPKSSDENNIDIDLNDSYCNNDSEEDWDLDISAPDPPKWQVTSLKVNQDEQKCDNTNLNIASPLSNVEPSDQLFDSGYQKSISNAEWSPQSPIDGVFEEHFNSCMKLDVNDIKDNIKANRNRNNELLSQVKSLPLNNKMQSDRKNMASSSSKKSPIKEAYTPPQGPSDLKKKRKSRGDDDIKDDVKNIANCIVYNSLNKIELQEDLLQVQPVILAPAANVEIAHDPPFIVENGDLANNNRDLEGNNYDEAPDAPLVIPDDNVNENLDVDDNIEPQRNNLNQDEQNMNDVQFDNIGRLNLALLGPAGQVLDELINDIGEDEEDGLNHASREALFDPNSQVDMLGEYAIPPAGSSVVLLGMRNIDENAVALPAEADQFPNWLLQLLGQNTEDDENHDEPHFYCQGDGLGVHPSIIEVDVEESSSDTSSGNDDAEAETAISEFDVGSLPLDSAPDDESLEVVGHSLQLRSVGSGHSNNDSGDEFFDTIEAETEPTQKNQ